MSLANCVSCGVSNMGVERATPVVVDSEWFCEDCLPKKKGRVKCAKCGREPFTSEEHFKTVDGKYMCTDCMEKAGIVKKYNYIMQAIAATTKAGAAPPLGAATRNAASALGGLRILLDQNLSPGETVAISIQGNAGEAIACSRSNVYILKSGLAVGSITGRKCSRYPWSDVEGIQLKAGNLYGVIEVENDHLPAHDPNVTFLLSRKAEFDQALSSIKSFMHR